MTKIDLDAPRFLAGDVVRATGIRAETLKDWLKTGVIPLGSYDVPADGVGTRRIFTARRVLQIGITLQLARLGVRPRRASALAYHFTDAGTAAFHSSTTREAGECFDGNDATVMLFGPGDQEPKIARASVALDYSNDLPRGVITLNPVVKAITESLGQQGGRAALHAAYR